MAPVIASQVLHESVLRNNCSLGVWILLKLKLGHLEHDLGIPATVHVPVHGRVPYTLPGYTPIARVGENPGAVNGSITLGWRMVITISGIFGVSRVYREVGNLTVAQRANNFHGGPGNVAVVQKVVQDSKAFVPLSGRIVSFLELLVYGKARTGSLTGGRSSGGDGASISVATRRHGSRGAGHVNGRRVEQSRRLCTLARLAVVVGLALG